MAFKAQLYLNLMMASPMQFLKEKAPLLSSILLTLLIVIGVGLVCLDAMLIRDAEGIEEDTSKLLLNAEQWLNHQQKIEVALRNYLMLGTSQSLDVIEESRRGAVAHEMEIKNVLEAYLPQDAEASVKGLQAFNTQHKQIVDSIVALQRAGDTSGAARSLVANNIEQFIAGAELIINHISQEFRKKRAEANAGVSRNVLRGSIGFGVMNALMVAIIWASYVTAKRTQGKNKELSDQLLLKATHDSLTKLPSRDLFYDRLSQSISLARRNRQHLAVLYLDLDGFKAINDTYGHQIGDATLKEAARRLSASVRGIDTVARLGGDEFAVVLNGIHSPSDASQVAENIIRKIAVPMPLYGGKTYEIGISVGIAIYPTCGVEIDRLVKAADHAMYESKSRGKNCFTYAVPQTVERPSADGWVNFVDDFQVGISVIDEQHEVLATMLNKLNVALAMQEPLGHLVKHLDEFIAYTAFHFQTEEQLMAYYHYPEATTHQAEHQRLVGEVQYLKARFVGGGELLVLQWLKDWLIQHVAGSDRHLSEFLIHCGMT